MTAGRAPGLELTALGERERHGRLGVRHVEQQEPPVVLSTGRGDDLGAVARQRVAAHAGSPGELSADEALRRGLRRVAEVPTHDPAPLRRRPVVEPAAQRILREGQAERRARPDGRAVVVGAAHGELARSCRRGLPGRWAPRRRRRAVEATVRERLTTRVHDVLEAPLKRSSKSVFIGDLGRQ